MALSVLDLFSVGIGPSSSHTVGPMRAARLFTDGLVRDGLLESVRRVRAELFGSLGATGHGHGSDKAVILGLQGADPETVDTGTADARVQESTDRGQLCLGGTHPVPFDRSADVIMHRRRSLPAHPNGMTFSAHGADGELLRERTYYSVGGGFVVDGDATGADRVVQDTTEVPHPFTTGGRLLEHCRREGRSIAGIMLANEGSWRPEEDTRASLLHIWAVMQECVENGCTRTEATLPGGLKVRRRAPALRDRLQEAEAAAASSGQPVPDALHAMEWINLYALAVNEENASGGRIVTAPTNGAAGMM